MSVSYTTTRKAEQTDRKNLIAGSNPQDLFNRAHAYNYLVSVLVGRGPKNLDNVAYPDGATSHLFTMSTDRTGAPITIGRNEISHGAKKAKRTHTKKRDKGSSSAAQSKRYQMHLVEDVLQSAFLHYWEFRAVKSYLRQGDNETVAQASARITRLTCRSELLNTFQKARIATGDGARGENKFKHTPSSLAILRNNDDMLSAETLCDTLAEMLANGDKKTARIVRATIGKTSKKKCLARALKCSRPTLDARLAEITLEAETTEKNTIPYAPCSPMQPVNGLQPVKVFHPGKATCGQVSNPQKEQPEMRNVFAFLATGFISR